MLDDVNWHEKQLWVLASNTFHWLYWSETQRLVKNCMPFGWRLLQSIYLLCLHSTAEKVPSLALAGWALGHWLFWVHLRVGVTMECQGNLVCKEGTEKRKYMTSIHKCSLHLIKVNNLALFFSFLFFFWFLKKKMHFNSYYIFYLLNADTLHIHE